MTSTTLKRLFVAVVSLLAVSAAFAIGYSNDFEVLEQAPHALDAAGTWVTALFNGDSGTAWNVAAAIGVMAIIAKRSGKA